MTNCDELKTFRDKWKDELQHKVESHNKSDEQPKHKTVQKHSGPEGPGPIILHKQPIHQSSSSSQKRLNEDTIASFEIAENLLRGENIDISYGKCRRRTKSLEQIRTYNGIDPPSINNEVVDKEKTGKKEDADEEDLLGILIADLDEITEIPFFDINLAREVAVKIFQYLDAKDLCRCSQVSKSWKSLAEDELLWSQICHKLGHENDMSTSERDEWKEIVKIHTLRDLNLKTNWKNRTGEFSELEHVKGGVLCAATSHKLLVTAGFSNGEVKLWDLSSGGQCVFQPSSTALILDEQADLGTVANHVNCVALNDKVTVAGYSQGYVDIWSNEMGTEAVHSFHCPQGISGLSLSEDNVLVAQHGQYVSVRASDKAGKWRPLQQLNMYKPVRTSRLLPESSSSSVVIATDKLVKVHTIGGSAEEMSTIHEVVDEVVGCLDFTSDSKLLACGIKSSGGLFAFGGHRVKLYDLSTGGLVSTYIGHTYHVSCINLQHSPVNMMVTGCADKKVRVYDLRSQEPVFAMRGHAAQITTVQMDEWKVISGGDEGLVCVWDQRMEGAKLWELHTRHPVRYCHFQHHILVTANIPNTKVPDDTDFDTVAHKRYRGTIQAYNFSKDQTTMGVPSICLSNYDEPIGYNYNINLAMPYDNI